MSSERARERERRESIREMQHAGTCLWRCDIAWSFVLWSFDACLPHLFPFSRIIVFERRNCARFTNKTAEEKATLSDKLCERERERDDIAIMSIAHRTRWYSNDFSLLIWWSSSGSLLSVQLLRASHYGIWKPKNRSNPCLNRYLSALHPPPKELLSLAILSGHRMSFYFLILLFFPPLLLCNCKTFSWNTLWVFSSCGAWERMSCAFWTVKKSFLKG